MEKIKLIVDKRITFYHIDALTKYLCINNDKKWNGKRIVMECHMYYHISTTTRCESFRQYNNKFKKKK